jgi:hypothetical protein
MGIFRDEYITQEEDLRAQLEDEETEEAESADDAGEMFLKRRVFDVDHENNITSAEDDELQALITQLKEAELYEANTQKQISAMSTGIDICLKGLNEGMVEAGYGGTIKPKEDIKGLDIAEIYFRATSGMKENMYSDFFFVYDDNRKKPELLEDYTLKDDVLEDLKIELVNMQYKVNELRLELRAAKANCVKYRSKVAVRKTMLA